MREAAVVVKNLSEEVYKTCGPANLVIFYVCGKDHFDKCMPMGHHMKTEHYKVGVVAAARAGDMPNDPGPEVRKNNRIFFAETNQKYASVSSTRIRLELSQGKLRDGLVHPAVQESLLNNSN